MSPSGNGAISFPDYDRAGDPQARLHQDRLVKGTQGEGGHPPACASQRPHSSDHRHRIPPHLSISSGRITWGGTFIAVLSLGLVSR